MRTMLLVGLVFSVAFLICFFMVAVQETLNFDSFAPMGFIYGLYMFILTGWALIKGVGKSNT